jgi:hypothetical protein
LPDGGGCGFNLGLQLVKLRGAAGGRLRGWLVCCQDFPLVRLILRM